jgi:cystathionine gamma-synthase
VADLPLRPESIAVAAGRPPRTGGAPLNTPIVLAAPLHHGAEAIYTRHDGSDTVRSFEAAVGALDGGHAVAFASGMAAVSAITEGLPAGAVAVAPSAAYSGTLWSFGEQQRLGRMTLREVDLTDAAGVIAALDGADLLWLETVTNPLMGVVDVPRLVAAARERGVTTVVDSTFQTPLTFRPLEHGADITLHSATKYLGGHSDLLMGVLVTAAEQRAGELRERRALTGAIPGALECYLALRGVRTLAVRFERAQANAADLAGRLQQHPRVTRVRYPGLADDPGHALAAQQFDGSGAMLAFEIDGAAADAERLCDALRLITHATSLGGVESLIERRARHTMDAEHGTPPTLLRFSVGIEHVEDLWADLEQALRAAESGGRDRGAPLAPAGQPQPVRRRRGERHGRPDGVREQGLRVPPPRRQLRRVADQLHRHVDHPPRLRVEAPHDLEDELGAGGPGPALVRDPEDLAQVAQAGGRQQGVADRVRDDVAVGVPGAAGDVRPVQPGQPALAAGLDRMNVRPDARAEFSHRPRPPRRA